MCKRLDPHSVRAHSAVLGLALGLLPVSPPAQAAPAGGTGAVPHLDHIIVIVMENQSYDGVRTAPYIASLVATGTSFANAYALTHPSQPNYLALWSGGLQGVRDDACPVHGAPFSTDNLGHACETAGLTWKAYAEDLPSTGYAGCTWNGRLYTRSHAPWTNFGNLNHANEVPMTELAQAETLGTLPNLAFVIPNHCNDMHSCPISSGDAWLSTHVPGMLRAIGPHGLVILLWDENDGSPTNQILVTFNGPPVAKGLVVTRPINHYTVLRTICDALGLAPIGAATTEPAIQDVWGPATLAIQPATWAQVKQLYQ